MYEIIEKIIKVLVVKRDNPVIIYTFFNDQLTSYYETNREHVEAKNPEEFRNAAIPILKRMETEGVCTITYEGSRILSFQIHKYYRQLVMKHYKVLEERPEYSFPDLKSLGFTINNNWLVTFNAQQNFMDSPELADNEKGKVLLITFGEGINNIVVPPEIIKTTLFDLVLKKVHLYIQNQNNFAYLGRYLRKAFENNEMAVKNMMESMLNGPPSFRDHIKKPADFSFKFFSFLCNKVLKDLTDKTDKTSTDISLYQSMALMRSFITYGRSTVQKDNQKVSDMKDLSSKVKKPPYIFSTAELFEIKDEAGTPYSKKYSAEFISEFINRATTRKEDEDLPILVRVSAEPKKEYYINRDMVTQVFLKTLIDNSKEIREVYSREWAGLLRKFKKNKEMQSDKIFVESLNSLIKTDFKLLNALLNPDLIFLANKSPGINKNIKMSVDSCFMQPGKFKSIDDLLNIHREELLKQIKAALPVQYSIPVIGKILAFFASLLVGKNKDADAGVSGNTKINTDAEDEDDVFQEFGSSSKDGNVKQQGSSKTGQPKDFMASITYLKNKYLTSGKDMNQALDELVEKWNYMVDKTARKNLTLDINSLIRDYLRGRKRVIVRYQTLNEKRIASLADDLVRQTSNLNIKNRDAFRQYIELYILKLLGNIKAL